MKQRRTAILLFLVTVIVLAGAHVWRRDVPPVDLSDFAVDRQELDPARNAFTILLGAFESMQAPASWTFPDDTLSYDESKFSELARIVASNATVFAAVEAACAAPSFQLPRAVSFSSTSYAGSLLKLSKLLRAQYTVFRLTGKPVEAMQSARVMIKLGIMFQTNPETIHDYLVGLVVLTKGVDGMEVLLADDLIPPDEFSRLETLLDEVDSLTAGYIRALKRDFQITASELDKMPKDTRGALNAIGLGATSDYPTPLYWISGYKPNETVGMIAAVYRESILDADLPYGFASSVKRNDWDDIVGPHPARMFQPNLVGKVFMATVAPATTRYLELKCHAELAHAAMRVAIAMNRYMMSNNSLPDSL